MINVFEAAAKLTLDTSEYDSKLEGAKNGIGSAFGSALGTVAKVGAAAVGAASAAVTAFAGSSIQAGMGFDAAISQVAATMGKSTDDLKTEIGEVDTAYGHFEGNLREFAKFMGANTAFSATQAAEALNYMALAGYDTQKSMEMLPQVMSLASSGQMDLARASDMVTDAESALGLQSGEVSVMVNQMAKTAASTNTSVEQLGDAILTIGGTAKNMTGGISEINQVLGLMADNGIKGSEAGTHLRNILMKMASPTKDAQEWIEKLGLSFFDAEGDMRSFSDIFQEMGAAMSGLTQQERLEAISDLFNARDVASVEALLGTTADRWDEVAEKIANAEGSAAAMAETQLDNLSGALTIFNSAAEGAKIALSDELTPTLTKFVSFATKAVSSLTQAFQSEGIDGMMKALTPLMQEGVGMIVDILPDIMSAGGQIMIALVNGIIANMPELISGMGTVAEALWHSLQENGPSLLESGSRLLDFLVQGIMNGLPILAEKAGTFMSNFGTYLQENLPTLISTGVQMLTEFIKSFAENIDVIIDGALQLIIGLSVGLIQALPVLIEAVPEIIIALVDALIRNVPKLIEAALTIVTEFVQFLMDFFGPGIESIGNAIGTWFNDYIVQPVAKFLSDIWQAIVDTFTPIYEFFEPLLTSIGYLFETIFEAIKITVSRAFTAVSETVTTIWNGIKTFVIDTILTPLSEGIKSAFDAMYNFIKEPLDNVKNIVSTVFDTIKNTIGNIIDGAKTWGKDLINNFVQGIKDKINAVSRVITDVANTIRDFLGFSEPDKGPLSNFHTFAPDMMKLFAEGISNNEDLIADQFDKSLAFATVDKTRAVSVNNGGEPIVITVNSILDGKKIGESTYKYLRGRERAYG